MRRKRKLVLLLCAAAVLAGGTFAILGREQKKVLKESTGTFALAGGTLEELAGVSWTDDGQTWKYTQKDGAWEAAGGDGQAVEEADVRELAEQLVSLQATRKIENVGSLAAFGLDDPAVTVTAEWRNGGSTAYRMGGQTPFEDGYYLAVSTQQDTVYTITYPLTVDQDKYAD